MGTFRRGAINFRRRQRPSTSLQKELDVFRKLYNFLKTSKTFWQRQKAIWASEDVTLTSPSSDVFWTLLTHQWKVEVHLISHINPQHRQQPHIHPSNSRKKHVRAYQRRIRHIQKSRPKMHIEQCPFDVLHAFWRLVNYAVAAEDVNGKFDDEEGVEEDPDEFWSAEDVGWWGAVHKKTETEGMGKSCWVGDLIKTKTMIRL